MARLITVTADKLYVGYDFINKFYYIINNDTTTARLSAEEAYEVATIIAPDWASTQHQTDVRNLATTTETLTSINYVLGDTGIGIQCVWFNTYKNYALAYANKTIYVNGSDLVYHINSHINVNRLATEISYFFLNQIGINVPVADITVLYNYLVSVDANEKYVFNLVAERASEDDDYMYNNILSTNTGAQVSYTATYNPDNIYTYTASAGTLATATQASNIFMFNSAPTTLAIGDKIKVDGADLYYDSEEGYTDDGIYTVKSILNTIVEVEEQIPFDYSQTANVSRITKKSITNGINVYFRIPTSDVSGATAPYAWKYDTTTVFTKYETPNVGESAFTTSAGATASFTITNVVAENTVTLSAYYNKVKLERDMTFTITGSGLDDGTYTIQRAYKNSEYTTNIVVYEAIAENYTVPSGSAYPVFDLTTHPTVYKGTPVTNTLLNITSSSIPAKLPTGEFMLDNTTQLTNYLNAVNTHVNNIVPVPTATNYSNFNTVIPATTSITGLSLPLTFKGIYSDMFK